MAKRFQSVYAPSLLPPSPFFRSSLTSKHKKDELTSIAYAVGVEKKRRTRRELETGSAGLGLRGSVELVSAVGWGCWVSV